MTSRRLIFTLLLITALCAGSPKSYGAKPVSAPDPSLTAAEAFIRLPVAVLDLLPTSTREDMITYAQNDSTPLLKNGLGGLSQILTLKPDFLEVRITEASTMQLKIFRDSRSGRSVLMTIYTVGNESTAKDSDVEFFDSSLNPIPTDKIMRKPELKQFFSIPKGSLTSMKEIQQMIPFPTYLFRAKAGSDDVSVELTIGEAIGSDEAHILNLFRLPEIIYRWNGKKLTPVK